MKTTSCSRTRSMRCRTRTASSYTTSSTPSNPSALPVEPLPSSTLVPDETTSTRPTPTGPPPCATTTSTEGFTVVQSVDGTVERNRYGDVQVRIQISGKEITDVQALLLP